MYFLVQKNQRITVNLLYATRSIKSASKPVKRLYSDLRIKYIPKYYWERPSMYKFVALVNTTSIKLLRNLSVYVCQAFKRRTDLLYGN